jgi:hypothetical protein
VAHAQGVEAFGEAGPDETIGSPWPPFAMRYASLSLALFALRSVDFETMAANLIFKYKWL